jgi:hypothetical protein
MNTNTTHPKEFAMRSLYTSWKFWTAFVVVANLLFWTWN